MFPWYMTKQIRTSGCLRLHSGWLPCGGAGGEDSLGGPLERRRPRQGLAAVEDDALGEEVVRQLLQTVEETGVAGALGVQKLAERLHPAPGVPAILGAHPGDPVEGLHGMAPADGVETQACGLEPGRQQLP